MIGVAAPRTQAAAVHEFFEMFKTPWEWLVAGKRYDVVLVADGCTRPQGARLALVYGTSEQLVDRHAGMSIRRANGPVALDWAGVSVPLHNAVATFEGNISVAALATGGGRADYEIAFDGMTLRRIGYDLFGEVSKLLFRGQPREDAHNPTLELHIDFMRRCLGDAGITYLEVPPRPAGAPFVCCLTHDIDFFGLRRARSSTLAGFVYRATVGALLNLLRGRRAPAEVVRNWSAVMSLPFVLAGFKRDPWHPFRDYQSADREHSATYFVVPFKNRPGMSADGTIPARRAVSYGIDDIRGEIVDAAAPDKEFAVHGIDAWRDPDAGRAELEQLTAVTGQQHAGVRMHWLYFASDSPAHLERAGFSYDSTYGYNDAVGFRGGTMQPFRLADTEGLLELPLAIMDTALFYSDRMGVSPRQARECWSIVLDAARRYGGAVVINWHDRSLAPERLWGASYDELLDALEQQHPWFATASEAVSWFRWRRSIRFAAVDSTSSDVSLEAPPLPASLPAARVVTRGPSGEHEWGYRGDSRLVSISGPASAASLS